MFLLSRWKFPLTSNLSACLTQFVFSRVVRDLHDVELQTRVALPNAVDMGDVRTLFIHWLHQLEIKKGWNVCMFIAGDVTNLPEFCWNSTTCFHMWNVDLCVCLCGCSLTIRPLVVAPRWGRCHEGVKPPVLFVFMVRLKPDHTHSHSVLPSSSPCSCDAWSPVCLRTLPALSATRRYCLDLWNVTGVCDDSWTCRKLCVLWEAACCCVYLGECSLTLRLSDRCPPLSRSGTRSEGWSGCIVPL